MSKRKSSRKGASPEPNFPAGSHIGAVILERLRRLNSFPIHPLDWRTEYFLNHFLGGRKRF